MATPGTRPGRASVSGPKAENDVYTALMAVAFLSVLTATVYLGYRALSYFDSLIPPGGG